jgi:hypothetical protein
MKIASVIDSQIVAVVANGLGKHFPALEGYAEIGNMLFYLHGFTFTVF